MPTFFEKLLWGILISLFAVFSLAATLYVLFTPMIFVIKIVLFALITIMILLSLDVLDGLQKRLYLKDK